MFNRVLDSPGTLRAAALLAAVLAGLAPAAAAAVEPAGSVTACRLGEGAADCSLDSGGRIRVEFARDDIVRIRIAPDGTFRDRPTGALVVRPPAAGTVRGFDAGDVVYLASPDLGVMIAKAPLRVFIWRADGTLVSVDQEYGVFWDRATGLVVNRKMALPGEHYLGAGERGGPLDRRGRRLTMRNTDWSAFTSLTDPLYIAIPYFFAFRNGAASGVYVDSGATSFFDFDGALDGTLSFGVYTGELDYYVIGGPEPLAVARGYRWLTGPNQLPPIWTLGYHQSRYSYGSQGEATFIAWLLRQLNIPADVLYFDIDYLDRLQMFTWNPAAFPDPAGMNALLNSWGFRTITIMEPLSRTDDASYGALASSGFFLTGPDSQPLVNTVWYGDVSWLDFSKTAARTWYKEHLKSFLASASVDGVWNDLNEPAQNFMPEAMYDFDGQPRTDAEARNLYALLEAKASFEAQQELRPDTRPWVFSRSGFSGLHRYGANWGGDADSTFASLLTNVETSLSMGLSGQPFFGHDIGGFLGSPTSELFLRWMTFSAYTPLFRNHSMNTSLRREPWAFGESNLTTIREIINERYRLIPYLYSLFHHDAARGEPVIAPLPFHFPADEATYAVNDQFLLGKAMLVAPVTAAGASGRSVYLPQGASWIDQRTDVAQIGGQSVFVPAAAGEIPVLIRDGSIIPRAPVAQSTSAQPADRRTLDIYCGQAAAFELYEDDGVSLAHERGVYRLSEISCTPGAVTVVAIQRTGGTWAGPLTRTWTMNLHRAALPQAVVKGSSALARVADESALAAAVEGWTFTPDNRLVVKVLDQPERLTVTVEP